MDSDRIERILNEHFSADEPDGMRERILRKAAGELLPVRRSLWTRRSMKLALAGAVLLLVLAANISDGARQARIAGATGAGYRNRQTAPAVFQLRQLTLGLMVSTGTAGGSGRTKNQL